MAFGLKHDPTNSNTYRQGTITMALIISTWPFVLIRIYVRAFMIKAFGADDYMIVAAQIFYTVFCIITFNEIKLVPGAQPSSLEIARKNLHVGLLLFPDYTADSDLQYSSHFSGVLHTTCAILHSSSP